MKIDRKRSRDLANAIRMNHTTLTSESSALKGRLYSKKIAGEEDLLEQATRDIIINDMIRNQRKR